MSQISTVILAAGNSTRFKGNKSKLTEKLAGLPIIMHIYKVAHKISGKNVIIVCNQNNIADLKIILPNCIFIIQKKQLGTADAILSAKKYLNKKSFLVLFGDTPLIGLKSINKLINSLKNKNSFGAIIGFKASDPKGYGRLKIKNNKVIKIIEEINTSNNEKKISICNSGIMFIKSKIFFENLNKIKTNKIKKERYLPDIIEIFYKQNKSFNFILCPENEMLGVNTLEDFLKVDEVYQNQLIHKLLKNGVLIDNPKSCRFSYDTKIQSGVKIESNVNILEGVNILSGTIIKSSSYLEGVTIKENCSIGPSARIRPKSIISSNVKIGNYVEIKNSKIGNYTSISHLSYIGDSDVGKKVTIGAGTITCNYDGIKKNKTIIKDGAFIGSNTSLIAPVIINKNVKIGAGSVIDRDIPVGNLALERSKLKIIKKK